MFYTIEVNEEITTIHRFMYREGQYLSSFKTKGLFKNQFKDIINQIMFDNCKKVIFNTNGYGEGFSRKFRDYLNSGESENHNLYIDYTGDIVIKSSENK